MSSWISQLITSPLAARLVKVGVVIAAMVHGYITAFHRAVVFRDFDIHREVGKRFVSGEYLYANDFCYAYLPVAAMYFAPLTWLDRSLGLAVRYGVAVGCLILTLVLFQRMVAVSGKQRQDDGYLLGGAAVFMVLQFVIQDLDDGGPHLILLGILTGGIYAIWVGREWLGSMLVGLGIVLKITPALFVLLFLWKRQWRVACFTVLATIAWIVLPVLYMGPASWWNHHTEWTRNAVLSVLDRQAEGRLTNEQRIRNQALRPTLLRYLVTYPETHPMRRDDANYAAVLNLPPSLASACVTGVSLALLGLLGWSASRSCASSRDPAWARDCAAVLVLSLLLSPMSWQQHLSWLVPAAFVVLVSARSTGGLRTAEWIMLGGYILLTMILNYEVLGKARFEVLLSYHPFGVAMILLFGLVVSRNQTERQRSLA